MVLNGSDSPRRKLERRGDLGPALVGVTRVSGEARYGESGVLGSETTFEWSPLVTGEEMVDVVDLPFR